MVQDFWPCVRKSWLLRVYPQFHLSPEAMTMPIMAILTQCLSLIFPFSCHACPFFYPHFAQPHFLLRSGNTHPLLLLSYFVFIFSLIALLTFFFILLSLYFKFLFFLPLSSHSSVPKQPSLQTYSSFFKPPHHLLSIHIPWYKQERKFLQLSHNKSKNMCIHDQTELSKKKNNTSSI